MNISIRYLISKLLICKKIVNFKQIAYERILSYSKSEFDIVIEGHFHQGVEYDFDGKIYINLSSFACSKRFFIVQSSNGIFREIIFNQKIPLEMDL